MSRYNVRYRSLPRAVKEIQTGERFTLNGEDWHFCTKNEWASGFILIEAPDDQDDPILLNVSGDDRCLVSTVVVPIHIGGTVDVDIKAWAREYGMESLPKPVADDVRTALALENLIPNHLRGIVHIRNQEN